MFHTSVVESDGFLDLPVSSQALYFHLGMHADDDGFINGPKQVARSVGCNLEDLQRLVESKFLLQFDDVVVIRHWRMSNNLRSDRLRELRYPEISKKIFLDKNKIYSLRKQNGAKNLFTIRKDLLLSRGKGSSSGMTIDGLWYDKCQTNDGQLGEDGFPRREEKKREEKKRKEKKREESSGEEGGGLSVPDEPDGGGAAADHFCELKYMGGKLGKGVVLLSDEQTEDLLDKLGLDGFDHYVEKLATFILKNDAKVKNHYATILRWWQEDRGVTYENKSFENLPLPGVYTGGLPGQL